MLPEISRTHDLLNTPEFFENSFQKNTNAITKTIQVDVKEPSKPGIADYLVAFSTQNHSYCVGCVDMVDSTKISASLSQSKMTSYYEIFLNSMSKILTKFGGKVIKNIGDCLLYYFPLSKDMQNSQGLFDCLDSGLAMINARDIINKELSRYDLPRLHYRVSADYGSVLIMNTTDSQNIDLIGPPVNMCTKINRCARRDEYVIGSDLYLIVKKFQKYKFKHGKSFDVGFPQSYPVYNVVWK